jgi:hypothetical protein
MAPELYSVYEGEVGDPIPRVTLATDVWAFVMTVIEARVSIFISPSIRGN